jgi:hypothetical protein
MVVFAQLRSLAEFRRRHLAFLETIEDQDLVREIGHYQVLGAPVTLKQLLMLGLGSVATVQRRLQRLKHIGVVHQNQSADDRRVVELTLSPACMKAFGKYEMLLGGAPKASSAGKDLLNGQERHQCVLCDGEGNCADVATRFLREGLRQGHMCCLVARPGFGNEILAELERTGRKRLAAAQLVLHGGGKSPESMLEFFDGVLEKARSAGKTLCVVGNTSWARGKMDFNSLMDFERRVDPLLRREKARALCQYDVRRFSSPQVLRALKCHPDTARYPLMLG